MLFMIDQDNSCTWKFIILLYNIRAPTGQHNFHLACSKFYLVSLCRLIQLQGTAVIVHHKLLFYHNLLSFALI